MRFLAIVLGLALPLLANAEKATDKPSFIEGKHYSVIPGQPKPGNTGKIEVTEVFWYGCGHCYTFESLLEEWEANLADDVVVARSPAMWRQRREPADAMWTHARLFYTAKALGSLDQLHNAFFEAMHKNNKPLLNKSEIAKLVTDNGLDGDAFVKTMDSFGVNAQVEQADARQRTYKITGTPEMVVGGYYHVSATKAGSQQAMLQTVDYLIDRIRSGK